MRHCWIRESLRMRFDMATAPVIPSDREVFNPLMVSTMKKPVFNHCNTAFTISWILTLPILIDICTACTLFSFWLVWVFFFTVLAISVIRLVHGFRQKCYKFCWALIAQLLAGAAILLFFQLSFNDVIKTPVSNPVASDDVSITNPINIVDSARIEGAYCPVDSDKVIFPGDHGERKVKKQEAKKK